jgi:hypothetical protein
LRLHDATQLLVLSFEPFPLWIEHARVLPDCARRTMNFRALCANSYRTEGVAEWLRCDSGQPVLGRSHQSRRHRSGGAATRAAESAVGR